MVREARLLLVVNQQECNSIISLPCIQMIINIYLIQENWKITCQVYSLSSFQVPSLSLLSSFEEHIHFMVRQLQENHSQNGKCTLSTFQHSRDSKEQPQTECGSVHVVVAWNVFLVNQRITLSKSLFIELPGLSKKVSMNRN